MKLSKNPLGARGGKTDCGRRWVMKRMKLRIFLAESLSEDWHVLHTVSRIVSQIEKRLAVVTFHMD